MRYGRGSPPICATKNPCACFLAMGARSPARTTSAVSACGRNARTSQRCIPRDFWIWCGPRTLNGSPWYPPTIASISATVIMKSRMLILHSLPKAELHLHLEGSIEPETLLELGATESNYQYADFSGFIEAFKRVTSYLRSPEDYALVTRRLLENLERQNVRYAEITLSAGVVLWRKQDFGAIYEAVRQAAARSSVEVYWILDAVRHFGPDPAMEVAQLAAE